MATGTQVITEAKKYLGEKGTKFWSAYGSGPDDWCCMFVWYIMRQVGASNLFFGGKKTAWVPSAQEWLTNHCTRVSIKNAEAGDIVIFTWGGGSRDHIGFAIKPINSKRLQTIEGNTGSSVCTASTVQIRERTASVIYGIYRPKYAEDKKVAKKSYGEIRKYRCVKAAHGYKGAAIVSGRIGKDTVIGSVYSATAWEKDFVQIPYLDDGWFPTSGSGGLYLERIEKIRYVVTNVSGANVYSDHTTKSKYQQNVVRGSYLTITVWYGKWGFAPAVNGWVAMSCLTEDGPGAQLFREMELIAQRLKKSRVIYSIDNVPRTLDAAIAAGKMDCAHYVSFGMQAMDRMPENRYIWLNKEINGNGAAYITAHPELFLVRKPNKKPKDLALQIGDICGYGYSGGQHTQVFAGWDSKGNPIWYSAGTSDVNGKSYGPKRKTTYEDRSVTVWIRLK